MHAIKSAALVILAGLCLPALAGESAATAFDVERETLAYLNAMSAEDVSRANGYVNTGYAIDVLSTLLDICIALALLRLGWSGRWRDWAERVFRGKFPQAFIYAPVYILVTFLLSLPLLVYSGFHVEHKYGLATQTFGAWLLEQAQLLGIEVIFLSLFVSLFYLIVRSSPQRWWLWSAGLVTAFFAFILLLSPLAIEPIFNEYRSMDEGPLKEQVLSIARANGMHADDVKQVDASKQNNRVSANVSGLFGTTRIALNDNLLARASPDGVEAVMAHEIGHYVLNHQWKFMTAFTLLFLLGFAVANASFQALARRYGKAWGIRGISDYAGLPLLYAIASVFFLVTTPVFNGLTRSMEAEADLFAINATQNPEAWAEIALLTADYRKPHPPEWEEKFLNHHPSPYARIRMAMVWKAETVR
jgi:STE24 endopeptidase